MRRDILYHDRYHLISFLLLAVVGSEGLFQIFGQGAGKAVLALAMVVCFFLPGEYYSLEPSQTVPDATPSLFSQLVTGSENVLIVDPEFDKTLFMWVQKNTAPDAVIATIMVNPYHYQRRFLQLLPVAQDQIDLQLPAVKLLAELRAHGANYIHLSSSTGFNPFMAPIIDPWLRTLREIPQLPGVHLVATFTGPPSEAIYRID
jgi:hypothetical protein